MSLAFLADLIGVILGTLVNMGFIKQELADTILSKFTAPAEDDMAL